MAECPVGAIEMKDGAAHIDPEVCIGCGKCFEVCPVEAVLFEKELPKKPPKEPGKKEEGIFADYRGVAVFIEVAARRGRSRSHGNWLVKLRNWLKNCTHA